MKDTEMGRTSRRRWARHGLSAVACSAVFLASTPSARAGGNAGDFADEFSLLMAAGVTGLTLNVLSIVAQTRRGPDGRVPPVWIATQYVTAAANLTAGALFVALPSDATPKLAGSIPCFTVGALWTTLAILNTTQRPRPPEAQGALRPFVAPIRGEARRRDGGSSDAEGWLTGFSGRF